MNLATLILALTLLLVTFQLIIYWFVFNKVGQAAKRAKGPHNSKEPVSVIICARNEEVNLAHYLPSVLQQNYPFFEVVVVDDGSTDQTAKVLEQLKKDHKHLRLITLPNDHDHRQAKGKKYALQKGIDAARNSRLLLTDADCYPLSPNWIDEMAGKIDQHTKIVLGFSPYEKRPGLLNRLIRFEGFFVGLQYLSFAMAGAPYMGVGRNLCIDKQLITNNGAFSSHSQLSSGDDDLVVQQLATAKNTATVLTKESIVVASPEQTFWEWLQQKHRHLTTSKQYRVDLKLILGGISLSQIATYPLLLALIGMGSNLFISGGLLFLLLSTKFTVFLRAMNRLQSDDLLKGMIIYDFLLSGFYINLGFLQLYKGQKTYWK